MNAEWFCHCCTKKNIATATKCVVCGRPESFVLEGYHFPFHGKNATLFRPSQTLVLLENIHEVDTEGWGSLHSACAIGNIGIVKELLSNRCKVEALNHKGQTPLHLAVFSGSFDCVAELLVFSADVNAATYTERTTPLHLACEHGHAKIAQHLIQHGASVNALNILERTPLHCAAMIGRTDIGMILLKAGAKHNVLDVHHWDPCQIAELNGHKKFQELLIREGMTVKQSVIKDLPPAKWHSVLWSEVVKMQNHRKDEYNILQLQLQQDELHLEELKQQKIQHKIDERKRERRQELEKKRLSNLGIITNHSHRNSVNVSNNSNDNNINQNLSGSSNNNNNSNNFLINQRI